MELTNKDISDIVNKSQGLWEQYHNASIVEGESSKNEISFNPQLANKRFNNWLNIAAHGDISIFKRRLTYDGLTIDKLKKILGTTPLNQTSLLPSWSNLLEELYIAITNSPSDFFTTNKYKQFLFLDKKHPLPFEELFIPVILLARKKLQKNLGEKHLLCSQKSHTQLERTLLKRLSKVCSKVLFVEFSAYLTSLQIQGISYEEITKSSKNKTYYQQFIYNICSKDIGKILKEYCVLAKFITLIFTQWLSVTSNFINRLFDDKEELTNLFRQTKLGLVKSIKTSLSDFHNGGQSVFIINFESGFKLIYKPKKLALTVAYSSFLKWVNSQNFPIDLKPFKILQRKNYGWVEYIEHKSMVTESQANAYFIRAGMLLGLIYIFGGHDFHKENIIASGEHPILIDLETFFHHRLKFSEELLSLYSASDFKIYHSVLGTHFLPFLSKRNGQFQDFSGMGNPALNSKSKKLIWKNINTNAMSYEYEDCIANFSNNNNPTLNQKSLSLFDYSNEVITGFKSIYEYFSILEYDKIPVEITALYKTSARFIFRQTDYYLTLLENALSPDSMREGKDFDIELEILTRNSIEESKKPCYWKIIAEERAMLWNLDVPIFFSKGYSDSLILSDGTCLQNIFSNTPFENFKLKLTQLDEIDLKFQISLIKHSIEIKKDTDYKVRAPKFKKNIDIKTKKIELLTRNRMIELALNIGKEIKNKAFFNERLEPSWIFIKGVAQDKLSLIDSVQMGFYDGTMGIAIFLAALSKVTKEKEYRELVYSTISKDIRWLNWSNKKRIIQELGIGGGNGIGGIIYSLVVLGKLLNDIKLINEAKKLANLITREEIDMDKHYDIMHGSSGTLLGLLALYKESRNKSFLELATYCGHHLLKNRVKTDCGYNAWKPISDCPAQTGFSHGAAGISFALSLLHQETGNKLFIDAVKEAIAYESNHFDETEKNWIDYRFFNDQRADFPFFTTAWCNGAPGIGLSRIGVKEAIQGNFQKDIDTAMETTLNLPIERLDHLCCGNIGRSEVLLTAGLKMNNQNWKNAALNITSNVLHNELNREQINFTIPHKIYNPTLFKGTAGLGYHLLRLSGVASLPAILLYET